MLVLASANSAGYSSGVWVRQHPLVSVAAVLIAIALIWWLHHRYAS